MRVRLHKPSLVEAEEITSPNDMETLLKPKFFSQQCVVLRMDVEDDRGRETDSCLMLLDGRTGRLSIRRPTIAKVDEEAQAKEK